MRFLVILFLAVPALADEWVRVKLWSEDSLRLQVSGALHRLQRTESPLRTVSFPQKQQVTLQFDQGHWQVEGFRDHTLVFDQKYLALEGPDLEINGRRVPEKVLISVDHKKIQVIGVLALEKYIMGVLAHEMPSAWPLETLKAQAIATRSYTLAVMKERKNKPYHLESTVLDQVYSFLTDEELKRRFDKITESVRATWGQVLVNSKNAVLKAYYHADCGGETASAHETWATKEELVSVQDSFCPQNPKGPWKLSLSEVEIAERLRKWAPSGAQKIKLLKAEPFPGRLRVAQVEVQWDQGEKRTLSASSFREAMGFFDLKSTQFKVQSQGGHWLFEGRGFGHGVGLCQWGSRYLGNQGWESKKILEHYYPKAQLKVLSAQLADSKSQIPL
jgi:stage II sporulation protein D